MDEDQAKTKWCPFVRYVPVHLAQIGQIEAVNRWVSKSDKQFNPEPAHCIGSGCMMWRELETAKPQTRQLHAQAARGYCGLARK